MFSSLRGIGAAAAAVRKSLKFGRVGIAAEQECPIFSRVRGEASSNAPLSALSPGSATFESNDGRKRPQTCVTRRVWSRRLNSAGLGLLVVPDRATLSPERAIRASIHSRRYVEVSNGIADELSVRQ